MNEGIKKAKGTFIQILNSDDILNSNTAIEKTIKKIKQNPKLYFFRKCSLFFK